MCLPHGAGPVTGFRKEPSIEVGCRTSVLHYLWDSVVCLGSRAHGLKEVLSFFLSVWNLMRPPSGLRRLGIRARHRTCYTWSCRILKQQPFPMRLSSVCCLMLLTNEKHRVLQLYKKYARVATIITNKCQMYFIHHIHLEVHFVCICISSAFRISKSVRCFLFLEKQSIQPLK